MIVENNLNGIMETETIGKNGIKMSVKGTDVKLFRK